MKKTILMMAIAIATITLVSCDKKTKTEVTKEQKGHDHKKGEAHQLAYVCTMDCEKGKIYDGAGKCPVCGMNLVEQKHKEGDKHDQQNKVIDSAAEEHGHTHGEEGHAH
jgi:hypothetical protein